MFRLANDIGSATLDGGLARLTDTIVEAAKVETLRVLEAAARGVEVGAEADWYGPNGVTRRTGASGDIAVVSEVTADGVRVSVGSTDVARARFVHRPGPLSTVPVAVERDEYWANKRAGSATRKLYFHARTNRPDQGVVAGGYYKLAPNPKASDGKYLLQEFVGKPGRAALRRAAPLIGAAIARAVGR